MEDNSKVSDLQLRVKELENLILIIDKNKIENLKQDLSSPSKHTRWTAKYDLLSRGIGIEEFINDEDQFIRNKAQKILKLRENNFPVVHAYLNQINFHINTQEDPQVVDITHSMFEQHHGGVNG